MKSTTFNPILQHTDPILQHTQTAGRNSLKSSRYVNFRPKMSTFQTKMSTVLSHLFLRNQFFRGINFRGFVLEILRGSFSIGWWDDTSGHVTARVENSGFGVGIFIIGSKWSGWLKIRVFRAF